MDGFAPVVATPERPGLCFASTRKTPGLGCEHDVHPLVVPWLQVKLAPAVARLQQCEAMQAAVSGTGYEYPLVPNARAPLAVACCFSVAARHHFALSGLEHL